MELVICNGPSLSARPSLDQKSVIDYIISDAQLLRESGDVCIDSTDIGMSDHFIVWLELSVASEFLAEQFPHFFTHILIIGKHGNVIHRDTRLSFFHTLAYFSVMQHRV